MMRWGGQLPPLSFGRTFFDHRDQMLDTLPLKMLPPFSRLSGHEELFLPYPNKELLIPLFINGVHLCGVFLVFDRDQCREFAIAAWCRRAGRCSTRTPAHRIPVV